MTSQYFAVSKLRIISKLNVCRMCNFIYYFFRSKSNISILNFNHPNQFFLLNCPRKGGNCMTTGRTCGNKARHLSMATRTNLW